MDNSGNGSTDMSTVPGAQGSGMQDQHMTGIPNVQYPDLDPNNSTHVQLQLLGTKMEQDFEGIRMGITSLSDTIQRMPGDIIALLDQSDMTADTGQNQSLTSRLFSLRQSSSSNPTMIQLQRRKEELEEMWRDQNRKINSLTAQLGQLNGELVDARTEAAKLRQKEATFRTIILDRAGDQKVSDEQVKDQFLSLRQRIQGLASGGYYNVDQVPHLPIKPLKGMVSFYDSRSWKQMPSKERVYRIRQKMFDILYNEILTFQCFGLAGCKLDGHSIEPGLSRFETALKDKNVSDTVISEWLITTIQCAEMLEYPNDVSSLDTSLYMLEFFAPVMTKPGLKVEDELKAVLLQLCEDATSLRMTMRKSKEGYRCEVPKTDFLKDCEDLVEPMGVEGGAKNKEASDLVAYTFFGALTKYPRYRGEEKRVLEKAHVLLKRK